MINHQLPKFKKLKLNKKTKRPSDEEAMPMTTFIAVQCCECSTMQVKQQKKSSNKWTCVVCNQKQSVRKVYAQALMARDVRKFVQSFNMSRQLAGEQQCFEETLESLHEEQIDDLVECNQRKRRTDWSQYIDIDDDDKVEENGGEGGDAVEPEFVTELPVELFKKPKLKNYSGGSKFEGSEKLFRPVFSRRNTTNKHVIVQDKESMQYQPTTSHESSNLKYNDYTTQHGKEAKTCQPPTKASRMASKWSDYITPEDDGHESELKSGRDITADQMDNWSDAELQILFNDQTVEEDIHPDFK